MNDDLKKFVPAFQKIIEDMSTLRINLGTTSYLSSTEQFVKSFETINKQHLGITQAIEPLEGFATSQIVELA